MTSGQTSQTYLQLVGETDRLRDKTETALGLKSGGGNGTSGGMEVRLARLESDVDYIKRDIGELKIDVRGIDRKTDDVLIHLARLDERSKHAPRYGALFAIVIGALALIAALVVYVDQIRRLIGITH